MEQYCPQCEPGRSFSSSEILPVIVPCPQHVGGVVAGSEDWATGESRSLGGSTECGEGNSVWCDGFHRNKWPKYKKPPKKIVLAGED